jgi:hypothetical protein
MPSPRRGRDFGAALARHLVRTLAASPFAGRSRTPPRPSRRQLLRCLRRAMWPARPVRPHRAGSGGSFDR